MKALSPLHSLVLPIVLTGLTALTTGCCKTAPRPSDELLAASKAAGVEIRADDIFTISSGSESIVTAPATAWAQIPAPELRKGVTFAFAHFSTSVPQVPAGDYALKAVASDIRVGTVDAKVQLLDRQGKVAAEIPSQAEIHTLELPAGAGSRSSFVTTLVQERQRGSLCYLWYRCPNGVCIRIPILRPRAIED